MTDLPPSDNPLLNRRPDDLPPAPPASSTPAAPQPTSATPPTAQPAPAKPAAAAQPELYSANTLSQVIDTLESVIIALVLALAFRAFVVEAFVIPTGSMAPTLYGAYIKVTCPKCGYEWAENSDTTHRYYPGRGEVPEAPRDLPIDNYIMAPDDRVCPNCREHINVMQLPGNPRTIVDDDVRHGVRRQVTFPNVNNGDRVLVLKYLYNFVEPERWDVVVFKEPTTATDNYIKRLIGRPFEKIEIIDGDIFVNDLIARKPAHVQDVMWQLVYDNDYFPIDAGKHRDTGPTFTPLWEPTADADKWNVDGPVMLYSGTGPGTLQFDTRDTYLTTMRGYNPSPDVRGKPIPLSPVGDVCLKATWQPRGGKDASISMTLGNEGNRFRATLNAADSSLTLLKYNELNREFEKVETQKVDLGGNPSAVQISMQNVDRAVQISINGDLVLEHLTTWTARDAYEYVARPNAYSERPLIQIQLSGAGALSHVKLLRDTYYTQMGNGPGVMGRAITLGADEFYVLGDNSNISGDSRAFPGVHESLQDLHTRRGVVPRRFMLGKAFFVYWPAGFRPFNGGGPDTLRRFDLPLVPNAGEMRFIR